MMYEVFIENSQTPNGISCDAIAGFDKMEVFKDVYYSKYLPELKLRRVKALSLVKFVEKLTTDYTFKPLSHFTFQYDEILEGVNSYEEMEVA